MHFHKDTLEWENDDLTYITNSNTKFDKISLDALFGINPQRTYSREGLVRDTNEVEFDDSTIGEKIVDGVGMSWNLRKKHEILLMIMS